MKFDIAYVGTDKTTVTVLDISQKSEYLPQRFNPSQVMFSYDSDSRNLEIMEFKLLETNVQGTLKITNFDWEREKDKYISPELCIGENLLVEGILDCDTYADPLQTSMGKINFSVRCILNVKRN